MLNLGVRAHDFGTLPIDILADRIAEKGFTSIQLAPSKALPGIPPRPGVLSPGFATRVRDVLARRGITVAVLGCYINPLHPDPRARAVDLERFTEHLRFARDFGCSVVATETGSRNPDCSYHPGTETEEAFRDFLSSVSIMTAAAEKFGVIVALEGVWKQHTVSTHERMVETLRRIQSPNLQVLYDPVNFLPGERTQELQRASMQEAFDLFGDSIVAVHAKDFTMENGRKRPDLPAGTGSLDYPFFLRLLKERKPDIHVLLENTKPESMEPAARCVRGVFDRL